MISIGAGKGGVTISVPQEQEQESELEQEFCDICGDPILVMAFKFSGVCSESHRKKRAGEAGSDFPVTNP